DGQLAQAGERVPAVARIAHIDWKALCAVDDFANVFAADCGTDHRLHVGDVQAVARGRITPDIDIDVAAAGQPLRECAAHARHIFHGLLNFRSELVYHL